MSRKNKITGLQVVKGYLKVPYQILRSKEFRELSPEATKIYCELLAKWDPLEPDKPIPLAFEEMKSLCKCGSKAITSSISELIKGAFVSVTKEWHRTTRFHIETWWFTDKYKK